jgi:hypothetical protein
MEVRYLVLCEHAASEGGKQYMSGAGVSNILVPAIGPQTGPLVVPRFSIALAVDVPYGATSETHTVRVAIEDSDGQPLLPQPMETEFEVGRPPGLRHDDWMTPKFAFNIQSLPFPKEGIYNVVVELDGTESARQRLRVRKVEVMAPVQG